MPGSGPALSRRLLRLVAGIALVSLLAGCVNLKPKPDPTRHYVLSSLPARTGPAPVGPALGLRLDNLPDYLRSTAIAVRRAGHEMHYADHDEWAERVDRGALRVLGANLSVLLPASQVCLTAWPRGTVQYGINVSIQAFEVNEDGEGALVAQWQIRDGDDRRTVRSGHANLQRRGPGAGTNSEGTVALMSDLLADLSRDLAEAVRALPVPAAAAPGPP